MSEGFPYSYGAFGLGVRSEIPLPELVEARLPGDVLIRKGALSQFAPELAGMSPGSYTAEDRALLELGGVGALLIRGGREIVAEPRPGASDEALRLFILGAGLGMLLHQRGALVLHASAVEFDGVVVAFLGEKGKGKSTLAAALQARGHRLVTDDVLALSVRTGEPPVVWPSFPQLKLWPDVIPEVLHREAVHLPHVLGGVAKRVWRAGDAFTQVPLRLGCLFVLDVGEAAALEVLPRMQAFEHLMEHAYLRPFIRPTRTERQLFQQCSRLAGSIPVARLVRMDALADLDRLTSMVTAHVRDLA